MSQATTAWLVALVAGCGTPQSMPEKGDAANRPVAVAPAAPVAALPAEVVAFRAKRDRCDQLRGEEPTDPARAVQLEQALARNCKGTDAALAALRRRYAGVPGVVTALAGYEDGVE